ncbi:hypothetical protein T459_09090 [Capsicum annuum]|nr:cytochrome P450 94A1-like [Capsicum annuum]PHT63504.1 hypothetical protein T459_32655 [Capsicum annuum]PHT86984.1 hypothetical protein T459_09090 [Capsicum annuum]
MNATHAANTKQTLEWKKPLNKPQPGSFFLSKVQSQYTSSVKTMSSMLAMHIELCCFLAFSTLVGLFFLSLFFVPSKKNQVYPKSYPLIGCSLEFIRNRARIIQWTSEIFDKLSSSTYTLELPLGRHVVCTKDPSNVKHILKTRFNNYHKERKVIEAFSDLFGKALFLSDGSEWKSQRQSFQHDFDPKEFHAYTSVVEEELSGRLVPFLSNAEKTASTVDLQDTLCRFTFDSVCQIGFGFDPKYLLSSLPPTPFADTYRSAAKLSILRYTTLPLIWKAKKFFNMKSEKRLAHMVDELHNFLGNIIAKKKERLLAREDLEDKDVLAKILRRAKGEQLDDTFLIHTAVNFIMGGHDAMCPALAWFFGLVSSNPNVEKVIVREIREKDGRLSDMVYMHASIYESLRLFPPFPADSKEAVEDDVWPDGTKVKKGTSIFYHIFAMGRSPELWGPDWPAFSPERWLERRSGSSDEWNFIARDPFMYPVFHAGPRTCLGKEIAVVIMKMVAATILKRFQVIPAQDNLSQNSDAFVTSRMKHGFPVRIIERH